MYEAAPDKMGNITAHWPQATSDSLWDAEKLCDKEAITFGMATSKMFIQTQMFIARL